MNKANNFFNEPPIDFGEGLSELQKLKIDNKLSLSFRIADLIKEKGLTKKRLANILGKKQAEVSKWLNGYQNVTFDTLTEIAFGLGVKVYDLLNDENEKVKNQNIVFKVEIKPTHKDYTARIFNDYGHKGQSIQYLNGDHILFEMPIVSQDFVYRNILKDLK